MDEGKLLGHIKSIDGIKIDPSKVEAILKFDIPRNKKELQSFIGKVIFLKIFLPNFVETCKVMTNMLRKNNEIKWTTETKQSFNDIKRELTEAQALLVSPDFSKKNLIFCFASKHTVARVLLQKNDQGEEHPIAFYNKILRDATLKYNIMEKKTFALVQAFKDFRVFILQSHIITYVPISVVKDILTQLEPDGKRGKWISLLLEYDMEINPTKLVKGQGLEKLMA